MVVRKYWESVEYYVLFAANVLAAFLFEPVLATEWVFRISSAYIVARTLYKTNRGILTPSWKTSEMHFFAFQIMFACIQWGVHRIDRDTFGEAVCKAVIVFALCRGWTKRLQAKNSTVFQPL